MGTKEKKSTIKFQKNKLKGVVKKRKETNKFKRQIQRRQIRRGAPIDPHKGKKTFLCNSFLQALTLNRRRKAKGRSTCGQVSIKREEVLNLTNVISISTPIVNAEDYFCNFVIDTEETLDLSDDEVMEPLY